ncbi:unnamed protein product [Blepharisma stoltei]|uniref:Rhodanese domain-containing protein n=1 Tax=Blepharisma stoltei TaxID=1481888 RepID=A0AAU9J4P8_9CILI|nr:unnamed protein product [Blepharisma stoltei]
MVEAELSPAEIERYHRQILLREFGLEGQKKLKSAKVLVIGAGGLGSPLLLYLAGAGIGTIGIVDGDVVETINLHRQIIHSSNNLKINKAESARRLLQELNPEIKLEIYTQWLTGESSASIVPGYDIIVIATDNVESRYLISDLGVYYKKPVISGSALRWEGQLTVFSPSPCIRCLFPQPTPRHAWSKASDIGVLGPIPGVIGTLQAIETIKLILGLPVLSRKLLMYDGLSCQFKLFQLRDTSPTCPACSGQINPHTFNYAEFLGQIPAIPSIPDKEINCAELKRLIELKRVQIIDVRNSNHFNICHIENSIHIPIHDVENSSEIFSSNEPLVFVCKTGADSARAVEKVEARGIEASYLKGGLDAWKEAEPSFIIF